MKAGDSGPNLFLLSAVWANTVMGPTNISITEADRVNIWVVTDNYYDALRPDSRIARRYRASVGRSIHAEHGLSFFVEVSVEGKSGCCMFDFGLDPAGIINNMKLLGLDAAGADAFALSHGHLDHWTAAAEIMAQNREGFTAGTPFYVGKEAFLHRYSHNPGTGELQDIGQLDRAAIEASGVTVVEIERPTEIVSGGYLTGDIDRITPYETTSPNLLVKRGKNLLPDDFRGEQALFFNIKDRGLVVLSGCAHAGIINTVRHVQKISGIETVYAIVGGFHLVNATEERIWSTISEIKDINPEVVVPAHCTGFEALAAFSGAMPGVFQLNTAGTQYTFEPGSSK
jgi:7,8-dihydropterin-6-yl-methyl-4-(beta-D-ribofuranosyl)aminobenzene 5'-phosphate synthase